MVTVHIPTGLRAFTNGREAIEVEGDATLRQIFDRLEAQAPGIKSQLIIDGDIQSGLAVFVNDEQTSEGLIQRIPADADIRLLPAMGGGGWHRA